jgi:hypothetical protein
MTKKPHSKQDDPVQSKRFVETARDHGAAETEKEAQRAFDKVVAVKEKPRK